MREEWRLSRILEGVEVRDFLEVGGDFFGRNGEGLESVEKAKYKIGCYVYLFNGSGECIVKSFGIEFFRAKLF